MKNINEESLKLHKEYRGKIEVMSKVDINSSYDLSWAYTPGVAEPCREIHRDVKEVYKYTSKGSMVAVVTDGSAVLGLGNIGAEASLPVMEGKCVLFKKFSGLDAFPIALRSQDTEDIIFTVKQISPMFGGINLEDISAPKCFEIERRLIDELDIPVFHDDQHGTAVVVLAGLINSMKILKKDHRDLKVVINGAGAAGIAIGKLLLEFGTRDIIICNSRGIMDREDDSLDSYRKEFAGLINPNNVTGSLEDAMDQADVFIGVSAAGALTPDMVKKMNPDSIVFAMANPIPEIWPIDAKEAGARIVGTGRSDFPNQVNNVLAFPGIFKGTLDARAREINHEMKIAAANAIAACVPKDQLDENQILPKAFDPNTAMLVSEAVREAAIQSGVSKLK